MDNQIEFGTLTVPSDINQTAIYIAPSRLPKDGMGKFSFDTNYSQEDLDEIPHDDFFGENIKRVIEAFQKK